MKDALRLMAKVFAVTFGAGAGIVVLGYLVLGGLYILKRIEAPPVPNASATDSIPLYDKGTSPDFVPDAQLDCQKRNDLCAVEIKGKLAAFITRQEAKDNLAGWMTVSPDTNKDPFANFGPSEKLKSRDTLPPCPVNDPLGIEATTPKCTPQPER